MKWNPFAFTRRRRPIRRTLLVLEPLESRLAPSATNVLTYHNDNQSSGVNPYETTLTPGNVNASTFGKLFSTSVDGQVYAQPLYVNGVNITTGPNQGVHNVVFVATEHDSLYALDATNGSTLWQDSLLNSIHGGTVTSVPSSDVNSGDLSPEIGITSTPVIDTGSNTIYVEAKTKEVATDGNHYVHQLYAINLSDGSYQDGGPVVIADSRGDSYVGGPTVNGTGAGSSNGTVYFDALRQLNRPGLTEANGNIYLGFASHGDNGPYHGWVLSYNASTLQPNGVFNTTPNGTEGGIWQAGGRIAVDAQGNLYFETGNGTFDASSFHIIPGLAPNGPLALPAHGDYGDSFVKIAVDPSTTPTHQNINGWGLKAVDYFTPYDQSNLNNGDLDLGSGAPLLLPDSAGSAAHPQLMVGAGKEGRIYLIDRNNMGQFTPGTDHVVQETNNRTISGSFDTPAFYNGTLYYVGGSNIGNPNDVGKTFSISNGKMSFKPTSQGPDHYAYPGSTPSISANGTSNGIVWDLDTGSNQLRAYDASGYNTELYTTAQAANNRDALTGSVIKFSVPTVVNGQVYVGTSNSLVVYGLLSTAPQAPAALPPPAPTSAPAATSSAAGVPPAPSNLTATASSGTEVDLEWQNNTSGQENLWVVRATDSSFTRPVVMPAGPGATTLVDAALTPGTSYYYRVFAANAAGVSSNSNTALESTPTLPSGVSNLQVTQVTSKEVDLSWRSTATNADRIDVWRQKAGNSAILIAELPSTATSLRDTGLVVRLVPGTQYTYTVQALNLAGPSPVAGVSTVIPPSASAAQPASPSGNTPSRSKPAASAGHSTPGESRPIAPNSYLFTLVQPGSSVAAPAALVESSGTNSAAVRSDPYAFNAALGYDGRTAGRAPSAAPFARAKTTSPDGLITEED